MVKLVNWYKFEHGIKDKRLLLFSNIDVQRIFGTTPGATIKLLHRYFKKGFIARVKRGIYSLSDVVPPEFLVANKIYEPSYISLEFALSYHRVIPETVYEITSVSTKATQKFETLGKIFSYRKIKKSAFTGYSIEKQKGLSFRIAYPEKAFVDYNYFRLLGGKKPLTRFNKEKIDANKALRYAGLFKNQKLVGIIKTTLR